MNKDTDFNYSTDPNSSELEIGNGADLEPTTVEWLVHPHIPKGKTSLLGGAPNDGKTSYVLTLAALFSVGKQPPALKNGVLHVMPDIEPMDFFYATTEDTLTNMVLPRFLRFGGDKTKLHYSKRGKYKMRLLERDIRKAIRDTGSKFIIFDPYQAFLPKGVRLTNGEKMRDLIEMLDKVAEDLNIAIILVGHINKNENARDLYRTSGSAEIVNTLRNILMFKNVKGHPDIKTVETIMTNYDESDNTPVYLRLTESKQIEFLGTSYTIDIDQVPVPHYDTQYRPNVVLLDPSNQSNHSADTSTTGKGWKGKMAANYIRQMSMNGLVDRKETIDALLEKGISDRTTERAAEKLGVVQVKKGNKVFWKL